MRRYFFSSILLMLTGCSHYEWQKPGASQQDFNTDRYSCMQNAVALAPAAVGNTAAWNNGGGSANVGANGGSASWNGGGGAMRSYDVNASTRNNLMKACMQADGWQWVKVSNNTQAPTENAPAQTPLQNNSTQ